jgi:hypothetical protein
MIDIVVIDIDVIDMIDIDMINTDIIDIAVKLVTHHPTTEMCSP